MKYSAYYIYETQELFTIFMKDDDNIINMMNMLTKYQHKPVYYFINLTQNAFVLFHVGTNECTYGFL